MKPFVTLGTAFLFLSLGTFVPVFAQQGQEEGKPEQKPQHAKQQNQDKSKQQDKQQQEKSNQPAATAQPPQQEPQNKPAEPRQAAQQKGDSQQTQQDQNKQPAATAQRAQPQNQNKHQQEHAQQQRPKQAASTARCPAAEHSATGSSHPGRAACPAGRMAGTSLTELGFRPPHLAATRRLCRVSHSRRPFPRQLWPGTQVRHLQATVHGGWRVPALPVRWLLVQPC